MNEIQKQMKALRVEHNMTQEELAEKMFVTKNAISNYENGTRLMDTEKLGRMCEIFGIELNEKRKVASGGPILIKISEIADNGFNLSASHYVNKQPVTMVFDIQHGLERDLIKIAERDGKTVEEVMVAALKEYVEENK